MNDDSTSAILSELKEQSMLLRTLVAIAVNEEARAKHDYSGSRFGSLEELLSKSAGLSNPQIGILMGKTRQTVEQAIAKKPKK